MGSARSGLRALMRQANDSPTDKESSDMAEVCSGNVTVIVLDHSEIDALVYLLESVWLYGTDDDDRALRAAHSLLDALDIGLTV